MNKPHQPIVFYCRVPDRQVVGFCTAEALISGLREREGTSLHIRLLCATRFPPTVHNERHGVLVVKQVEFDETLNRILDGGAVISEASFFVPMGSSSLKEWLAEIYDPMSGDGQE